MLRKAGFDLDGEIALYERDRCEDAEPEAERQHDPHRRCAGPVQIGKGQPHRRPPRPRQEARDRDNRPAGETEQREGGNRAADIPQRDAAIGRARDDKRGKPERRCTRCRCDQDRHAAPCPRNRVAEQRGGRDPADRGERPQREDQHRQQAAKGREPERQRIDREPQFDRQQPRHERRDGGRGQAAEQQAAGDADNSESQDLD